MECVCRPLKVGAVLLFAAQLTAGSFLSFIPGDTVKEGERVVVKCSEVFPFGVTTKKELRLRHNISSIDQYAFLDPQRNRLTFQNWIFPDGRNNTVKQLNVMRRIYTISFEFTAAEKHNGMLAKCWSSEASTYFAPKKKLYVQRSPRIMSCSTSPLELIPKRSVEVSCWVLSGLPPATTVKLSGKGFRKQKWETEYSTNSMTGYFIQLYKVMVHPLKFDKVLRFRVQVSNSIGSNFTDIELFPKSMRKSRNQIAEPNARIILEPDKEISLLVGDNISCRVRNTTRRWNVKLNISFNKSSRPIVIVGSSNIVTYTITKAGSRKLMTFNCTASSQFSPHLKTETRSKTIMPANHRTFLFLSPGTIIRESDGVLDVSCYFLPGPDESHWMNISIVSSDKRYRHLLTYNGSKKDIIINGLFGNRIAASNCQNDSNLMTCNLKIVNLKAPDSNATVTCQTKTGNRINTIQKRLSIHYEPFISLVPQTNIEGFENDTLNAICLIRLGNPEATQKNFTLENSQVAVDPIMRDADGSAWQTLRMEKRLTIGDNGKRLMCSAKNNLNEVTRERKISVVHPISNMTISPSTNSTLTPSTVFVCRASGYPRPTLRMTARTGSRSYRKRNRRVSLQEVTISMEESGYLDYRKEIEVTCSGYNMIKEKMYRLQKKVTYLRKV